MSLPEQRRTFRTRLHRTARKMRIRIVRFFSDYSPTGTSFLLLLSVLIGVCGGLGAVLFRWLIEDFSALFLVKGPALLGHTYLIPLVPAIGGLVVGFLVLRRALEARMHGVPEVMEAVAIRNGRIRPRVVLVKGLASAPCIGSGGSVGRAGPIVHIGSTIGSSFGQFFGFSGERLKILVGCGAAAGISATFNAPVAGGLFALGVILGDFTVNTFSPILLSSVLAAATSRYLIGNEPAFSIPEYQHVSPYELFYYAALAVLAGLVAVGFTRLLYRMEDAIGAIPISRYAKPVIGGGLVGCIGIYLPQVFGVGFETITEVLLNRIGLSLLLALLVAKLAATSFSLGS